MDYNCKKVKNNCCLDEKKMAQSILSALEKLKDVFGETLGSAVKPKTSTSMRSFKGRGVSSHKLRKKSHRATRPNGRSDRNAMVLLPGEVGLRGDRATFHLGPTEGTAAEAEARAAAANGWRPTGRDRAAGAVYYRMRPDAADRRAAEKRAAEKYAAANKKRQVAARANKFRFGSALDGGGGNNDSHDDADDGPEWQPKKHVMQVIPSLPASKGVTVGPVTGLPVGDDEHVFVLWVDKRHGEPDEKARLQIEMRVPKVQSPAMASTGTQWNEVPKESKEDEKNEKKKKKSKKNKKMAAVGGKKEVAGVKKKTTDGEKKVAGGVIKAVNFEKKAVGVEKKAAGSEKMAAGGEKKVAGGAIKAVSFEKKAVGVEKKAAGSEKKAAGGEQKVAGVAIKAVSFEKRAAGKKKEA